MLKRFIDGIVFGSGFGIAFSIIWIVGMYFIMPSVVKDYSYSGLSDHSEQDVASAPRIEEHGRFLDSTGIYDGDFARTGVLSRGPGRITGSALVNDEPAVGLKLRLALNGSVMSQWATTDSSGKYSVRVPYGEYRIDGYELDTNMANRTLSNTINHPQMRHRSGILEVTEDNPGHGLDFRFVNPIVKKLIKRKYSVVEDIVFDWEPYPNAVTYTVQIYEKSDPHSWSSEALFRWPDRPELLEPSMHLKEFDVELKPGRFYILEVLASDRENRLLSKTARQHSDYDFEIVE